MTKLSDLDTMLLSTASQRDGNSLLPPPGTARATGARLQKAIARLLDRGLAEERSTSDAAAMYRSDGDQCYGAFITCAGLAAIGVGDAPADEPVLPAADGRLTAIGHDSWSGNLPGGRTEPTVASTRTLYAGANRLTRMRLATLDLAEGNAMRAPGEAPGLMALEVAMDELAEKLGMDPVQLRIVNDTQVDPEDPSKPFSTRAFVRCLQEGAERFGWERRTAKPGQVRDGRWLIGYGMAGAIRAGKIAKAGARARLSAKGIVTIETDMTDIGTGMRWYWHARGPPIRRPACAFRPLRFGTPRFWSSTSSGFC